MGTELVEQKTDVLSILAAAVERGADADQLEKLLALQERYERNEAEKAYTQAMQACQAEMPVIVATATNPSTHSKYAKFETIQEVAKPVYVSHGFSLSFGEEDGAPEGWTRNIVDVRHIGGAVHRYHKDLPIDGTGPQGRAMAMNKIQGCGSTASYARRYLTCLVFNLTVAGEDRDGNQNTDVITSAEADKLQLDLVDAGGDEKRFLNWIGVETFADVRRCDLAKAQANIKRKAKQ